MSDTLIVFATRYGQTERIASRIAQVLNKGGMNTDLVDLGLIHGKPSLERYSLIVLAGPVYFGKHPRTLERFVRANRAELETHDTVLVSVSGSAIAEEGRAEAERCVATLTQRTGWKPGRTLLAGGAVSYTRYNFFVRWMMRRISASHGRGIDTSRDYDYTNWQQVEQFARTLLPVHAAAAAS